MPVEHGSFTDHVNQDRSARRRVLDHTSSHGPRAFGHGDLEVLGARVVKEHDAILFLIGVIDDAPAEQRRALIRQ